MPSYVTDSGNKRIAVQLPIETYEKIEEVLENYGLYQLMEEEPAEKPLKLKEAKEYYSKLKKKK